MVLSHFCFITYAVGPAAPSSSQQWKRKSGFWVKRLIPFYIKISSYYLECHFWCCGKMSPVTDCWSSALLSSDVWCLDTVRCSRPGVFRTRTPKVKGKVPPKMFVFFFFVFFNSSLISVLTKSPGKIHVTCPLSFHSSNKWTSCAIVLKSHSYIGILSLSSIDNLRNNFQHRNIKH